MPRTTTLECSGCPPIRALTFDVLGLIKVIEARSKEGGVAKVVEKWGEPDPAKCLLAASIDDRKSDPVLAVARRSGAVEILNPLNGEVRAMISSACDGGSPPDDDTITGLHLLKTKGTALSSRSCTLLSCTRKGNAVVRSVVVTDSHEESAHSDSSSTWDVCNSGTIECSKVDRSENYALFGGKGVEVNVWDLDKCSKIWTAKSPPKNSLGIFTPTWFTSAAFLSKDDHRKFVAGTNSHQVRLYDISAQRRPVLSFDFRETAIKSVTEDLDGHRVYVGNGSGDLASFDMRTGKLLGCFLGKCSGSIRSIARHPELPVIASCGLDSYLRLWDINSRQLLSAVFLKQHLTNVVFDSNFSDEEPANPAVDALPHEALNQEIEEETIPIKRKKKKSSNKTKESEEIETMGEEETLAVKRKKKRASSNQETETGGDEETLVVKSKKKKKVVSNTNEGSKKSALKEEKEIKKLKSKKRTKKQVKDDSSDDASDS